MVMPFTTMNGYVHILRHLRPDLIYLEEHLAGRDGSSIHQLQTWFRNEIIIVVGTADGEDISLLHSEDIIGHGKGVCVVDTLRIGVDLERRLAEKK